MTDYPDTITVAKCDPFRGDNFYITLPGSDRSGVEYIRADLAAAKAARIAELERQLALVWARSVKPLVWSEPSEAGGGIRFNGVRAESVLGEYTIAWECGKENAEYVVYHCGLRVAAEPTIDAAKAAAQADYEAHIISALKDTP